MTDCPHFIRLVQQYKEDSSKLESKYKHLKEVTKCSECSVEKPAIWACMQFDCNYVGCSRTKNKHFIEHLEKNGTHCVALNLFTFCVWCYVCDDDVTDSKNTKQFIEKIEEILSPPDEEKHVVTPVANYKPGLCGLENLGNTCYLNASLQSLSNVPPLTDFLINCPEYIQGRKSRFLHDYARLVRLIWSGQYNRYPPSDVVRAVFSINPIFRGYDQQDSQECLRCILDHLHEMIKNEVKSSTDTHTSVQSKDSSKAETPNSIKDSTKNQTSSSSKVNQKSETSTKTTLSTEFDSIIANIFSGVLLSRVKCSVCKKFSDTKDKFYDLSLSVPNRKLREKISKRQEHLMIKDKVQVKDGWFSSFTNLIGLTTRSVRLEDCLHGFCCSDELSGGDKYKCDHCKILQEATKTFSILQPPEVLCIHIKRFRYDSFFGSKISDHVAFPLEGLDIRPYCSESSSPDNTLYDLCAVINHRGGLSGGHYVAYCKNKIDQKWYEFDDRVVTEVSESTVKNVEAYVLFFVKRKPLKRLKEIEKIKSLTIKEKDTKKYYVSKYWYQKWLSLENPGPITNDEIICPHMRVKQEFKESIKSRVVALSEQAFYLLYQNYGGHKLESIEPCEICLRRIVEKKRIKELDRTTISTGEFWYLLSQDWLLTWQGFIKGTRDLPPAAVSNYLLLQPDGTPKEGLKRNEHYRGVTKEVWEYFISQYGGGPPIIRSTIEIYSPERNALPKKSIDTPKEVASVNDKTNDENLIKTCTPNNNSLGKMDTNNSLDEPKENENSSKT
eukprot:TRINITY_DN9604_c0_g1_i1.p1 TRINITY_DN9604_c0_g1~~TRINITY_DN9604_c0_g1_i1.p1  ORF type:complete len:781 (-),score=104.18 TRINITY_DN9604_c0_g1_i1:57-2399(-)